jgi:uncharacterized protein YciI
MESPGQFIYVVRPTRLEMLTAGPTPEEDAIVGAHFEYLEELAEKGTVLLVGRTQNNDGSTFGLCIFEAGSEEEAREIMNRDPAVDRGVMSAELFPYRIAIKGIRL